MLAQNVFKFPNFPKYQFLTEMHVLLLPVLLCFSFLMSAFICFSFWCFYDSLVTWGLMCLILTVTALYTSAFAGFVTYQQAANQARVGLILTVWVRISVLYDSLSPMMQTSGGCLKHTLQLHISVDSLGSPCSCNSVTFTVEDCN